MYFASCIPMVKRVFFSFYYQDVIDFRAASSGARHRKQQVINHEIVKAWVRCSISNT